MQVHSFALFYVYSTLLVALPVQNSALVIHFTELPHLFLQSSAKWCWKAPKTKGRSPIHPDGMNARYRLQIETLVVSHCLPD